MPLCFVALHGQNDDLQALSTLQSADWRIVYQDGTFYLTSALLEMARDADDAMQFAREILPIINGAAQVYLKFRTDSARRRGSHAARRRDITDLPAHDG